jgi:AraC family transcriptional regulator
LLFTDHCDFAEQYVAGCTRHFKRRIRPGDLQIYGPETTAQSHLTRWTDNISFISVMLDFHLVADTCLGFDADYVEDHFLDRVAARDRGLERLTLALGQEMQAGAPGGRLYSEHLMQGVARRLIEHFHSEPLSLPRHAAVLSAARLRRIDEYVRTHFHTDIAIADLAREAAMSPYHFCRAFKASMGITPHQYVLEHRVEAAKRLLRAKPMSLAEVAVEVGFASQSHLTGQFQSRVGATPAAYRAAQH